MGSIPQLSVIKGEQRELVPKLLHKIYEENLELIPDRKQQPAIIFTDSKNNEQIITYDEFNKMGNKFANVILTNADKCKSIKNQDGDWIVAVCMQPSNKLILTLMSIWKSGAAYLPIDPSFPANRVEHILNESRPILVIHDESSHDLSIFGHTPCISFDQLEMQASDCSWDNIPISRTLTHGNSELGIVLYTSGSTGVPKGKAIKPSLEVKYLKILFYFLSGVRLPHSVILNRLQWQWNTFPHSPTEKIGIFKTALTFVDSVPELWSPLLNGSLILQYLSFTKELIGLNFYLRNGYFGCTKTNNERSRKTCCFTGFI